MASCNCSNPPGGQGRCGRNQAAFCRVMNGLCVVTCVETGDFRAILRNLRSSYDISEILEWFTSASGEEKTISRSGAIRIVESSRINLDMSLYNDRSAFFASISRGTCTFLNQDGQAVQVVLPAAIMKNLLNLR